MLHVAMPELVQVPDLALGLGGGAFVVFWKNVASLPRSLAGAEYMQTQSARRHRDERPISHLTEALAAADLTPLNLSVQGLGV